MPNPTHQPGATSGLERGPGARLPAVFPREFERSLLEAVDRRFAAILLASLLIHLIAVTYFATHPPAPHVSEHEIRQIQKRFASLVLERPAVEEKAQFTEVADIGTAAAAKKDVEQNEPKPEKGKKGGGKKGSSQNVATVEGRRAARSAGGGTVRRRTREQIQRAVSNQGILGLLTSTSSAAAGSEVEDVLQQGKVGGNLDKALEGVSGLKRGGAPGSGTGGKGRDVRASRETGGGGIDDLVEGLGKSEVSGVSRSGGLAEGLGGTLLEENEGEVGSGARDVDKVAAVVKSHYNAIQYCYQRELRRNPNLRGKIVVRFIIDPSGRVNEVKILSSTLRNSRVERCIVNRIKRWTFGAIDPSKGNTAFRQVYTFGY